MQNLFTGGFRNLKFANYYKSDCNLDYRHQPQHGSQFGGAVPVVSGELDCNNGLTRIPSSLWSLESHVSSIPFLSTAHSTLQTRQEVRGRR